VIGPLRGAPGSPSPDRSQRGPRAKRSPERQQRATRTCGGFTRTECLKLTTSRSSRCSLTAWAKRT